MAVNGAEEPEENLLVLSRIVLFLSHSMGALERRSKVRWACSTDVVSMAYHICGTVFITIVRIKSNRLTQEARGLIGDANVIRGIICGNALTDVAKICQDFVAYHLEMPNRADTVYREDVKHLAFSEDALPSMGSCNHSFI